MNIIVTDNAIDYSEGFIKVSSLEDVTQIRGTIDTLVYNTSTDTEEKKIEYLGKLKDRVKKLIYICDKDKTSNAIKLMVIGSEGKYIYDEFFLESSKELLNLVNSLDEVTEIVELGGLNILSEFFKKYLDGDDNSDFNSNYLAVVKDAVNTMVTEYNQKRLEILEMSETATDVFSNTSSLLASMREENKSMQDIVQSMKEKIKQPQVIPKASNSVLFYPRVDYLKSKTIIRVKEIGDFKYLTSFMLGLKGYLEDYQYLKPKLIFIKPYGELIETMYKDFTWVTQSTYNDRSLFYKDVVFTNHPNKSIVDILLSDNSKDIFIVVDCTKSYKEHILNCKGKVLYAVGNTSYINSFKLPIMNCITNITEVENTLCNVPVFTDYPKDELQRKGYYESNMINVFNVIYQGIRRR